MSIPILLAQTVSITVSLTTAGSIATMSLFDIPEIRSQPADRALPMIRWLFSRGSHVAPPAAFLSSATFAGLAYAAIPRAGIFTLYSKSTGYALASLLCISIAPFTQQIMIKNNFDLIQKNESLGGARSSMAAKTLKQEGFRPGQRTAEDSTDSKGEGDQFKDLSDPQTRAEGQATTADDEEVKEMLTKFARQNLWRAALMGAGGTVGLVTALL